MKNGEQTQKPLTFQRNAKGVQEMLSMKFDTLDFEGEWAEAFGAPERRGGGVIRGHTGQRKNDLLQHTCHEAFPFRRVASARP